MHFDNERYLWGIFTSDRSMTFHKADFVQSVVKAGSFFGKEAAEERGRTVALDHLRSVGRRRGSSYRRWTGAELLECKATTGRARTLFLCHLRTYIIGKTHLFGAKQWELFRNGAGCPSVRCLLSSHVFEEALGIHWVCPWAWKEPCFADCHHSTANTKACSWPPCDQNSLGKSNCQKRKWRFTL